MEREAIWDILSSLRSHLHRKGYTATPEEDPQGAAVAIPPPICLLESWSRSRKDQHGEAFWEDREAHQWVLEAAHTLEHDIKRLSQGVEDAPYPHPCSCSGSYHWSKSLDRHPRSTSQHRLERWVTFWELEVESDISGRPYREPQEHSFRMHVEKSSGVPLPTQRQEVVHPWETPMAYLNIRGGRSYLPEPSIRNVEVWLDWQACLMDTPHWWGELTVIPEVEDPRKLAWKIHASFSIPGVRCETFPGQEYTMPPATRCLTRGRFIPNNPSYQDVWQQPLLMTVAYTQALQYWVEQVRPPVHPDYHPLANEHCGVDETGEGAHHLL